jgi:hypothetical protein
MDGVDVVDHSLSIVGRLALTAGEAALFIAVPWLNLPIIRQIVEFVLSKFEDLVVTELKKSSNAIIIFVNEEDNAKEANAASIALKAAQTPEEKAKATEEFKRAFQKLIKIRIGDPTAMDN